jgi:hypothetical protein
MMILLIKYLVAYM